MKIQTLVLFFITAGAACAQEVEVRYVYPEYEVYQNKPPGEKHTVSIYVRKGKGKRLEEQFSFNNKGEVDRELEYKRNGSLLKETRYDYNDSTKMTRRKIWRNNRFRNMYQYQYTNQTLIASSLFFYKDSVVPKSSTVYEYVLHDKIKSITTYDDKKNVGFRYEYAYNDQGQRTESRFYKKGKLKHAWVHDCSLKGELVSPKTVKICKNRNYAADSSFTEIFESTKKGKVTRTIVKSAADGRVLEHEVFDAKGITKSKSVYQYNDSKQLVKRSRYKGKHYKPESVELYEYGSDSSLIASVHLSKKGEVTSRKEFLYN
jgi:hypothetical protein